MADKAKHAHGSRKNLEAAIASKTVDAYDVLFLSGEDEAPAFGWMDKNGNPIIIAPTDDLAEVETKLKAELAAKVDAEEVKAKVDKAVTDSVAAANAYTNKMVEAAMEEHLTKKYEIVDVPEGTLVDYRESEIRIMCKPDAQWVEQAVGVGGDPNCYYCTLKTYAPSDNAVGYIEHLSGQVDKEVLTDLRTDEYGRRYQPTWLALARYDKATGAWSYYGEKSSVDKYIGFDYQIDWYDANGVMIDSDSMRINLSNKDCHYETKPYYVGSIMKEIDTKIAEVESAYEVIEF